MKNIHVRPDGVGLKHHPDGPFLGWNQNMSLRGKDAFAVDINFSVLRVLQSGDAAQSRALALAAGTEKREKLSLTDVDADVLYSANLPLIDNETFS